MNKEFFEGGIFMKKKKILESFYQRLKNEEKLTGKKFDKFALKFAKAVDTLRQIQTSTNSSIWDVYMEGRK